MPPLTSSTANGTANGKVSVVAANKKTEGIVLIDLPYLVGREKDATSDPCYVTRLVCRDTRTGATSENGPTQQPGRFFNDRTPDET